MNKLLIPILAITFAGCEGKIEIVGEGDVLSNDGLNCYLEYEDCSQVFTEGFQKQLTAEPREGFQFVGWDYCQSASGNVCTMDVSTEVVKQGFLKDLPPVTVRFTEIEPVPPGVATYYAKILGAEPDGYDGIVVSLDPAGQINLVWLKGAEATPYDRYRGGTYFDTGEGLVFSAIETGEEPNEYTDDIYNISVLVYGHNLTVIEGLDNYSTGEKNRWITPAIIERTEYDQ